MVKIALSLLIFTSFHFVFFQINPNSKAYNEGVQVGDYVEAINGKKCQTLMHQEALQLIKDANSKLKLELKR